MQNICSLGRKKKWEPHLQPVCERRSEDAQEAVMLQWQSVTVNVLVIVSILGTGFYVGAEGILRRLFCLFFCWWPFGGGCANRRHMQARWPSRGGLRRGGGERESRSPQVLLRAPPALYSAGPTRYPPSRTQSPPTDALCAVYTGLAFCSPLFYQRHIGHQSPYAVGQPLIAISIPAK